ncbi:MAG: phosphatase PAP2 family protein [Hymenobacteraceae bacterium]|nr:phosphatase PAP2 family protein [Hymenobacteraceae bacterium]MDX5395297.1 phosphatase PAP2 family protein [Hymenobacteraceae bacterium]MDX5442925.1 phosphatase PAP2 family protein [Hymenobacteraceae bacterium]MDX5511333.1 phosphatase PAP2 family protein [Hymenobacteraceae bacterium]
MKKYFFQLLIVLTCAGTSVAQTTSPYKTKFAVDGTLSIVGVGLNGVGLYLIQENKKAPSAAELAAIDADIEAARQDVNSFDRFAAGNYSLSAKKISDYPFYGSFGLPLLLLFDKDISQNAGQTGVLYLETMALTGAIFTMTVAHVERKRPLVYNNDPDNEERTKKHAQNSFFAGHTAAAASATFFAAKVFHDYNPDSPARLWVWTGAALVPAAVGYLRLEAGKHFLSDNLLGYALGAGAGILVPQLHKVTDRTGLSITPVRTRDLIGNDFDGIALTYKF